MEENQPKEDWQVEYDLKFNLIRSMKLLEETYNPRKNFHFEEIYKMVLDFNFSKSQILEFLTSHPQLFISSPNELGFFSLNGEQNDTESPQESITTDNLVPNEVQDNSPNPGTKSPSFWCHQCKIRREEIFTCSNNREGTCAKKYCKNCINRHYDEIIINIDKNIWVCYFCRGICSCAQCRRKRGECVKIRKRPSPEPDSTNVFKKRKVTSSPTVQSREVRTSLWEDRDSLFLSESTNQMVSGINFYFSTESGSKVQRSYQYKEGPNNMTMENESGYYSSTNSQKTIQKSYYPSTIPEEYLVPLLYEDSETMVPFCFSVNYPLYKYQEKDNFIEYYSKWR